MSFKLLTSAPAKIILFGEHAVVYGQPALAVPIAQLRAQAEIIPTGQPFRLVASDIDESLPINIDDQLVDNALAHMARLTLQALNVRPPNVSIIVSSQIPLASGLGSGAAVSAALGRAIAFATNGTLPNEQLNRLVYEVEGLHHGTPSGVDNTVIVYERPVYFVRDQTLETFSVAEPVHLLIADTGNAALTKVSVGDVRKLYETDPAFTQPLLDAIGQVVQQARVALESGDLPTLGALALENHRLLRQLTVSSPELDTFVQVSMEAGAYGAKLSGGGRGGNMIAFVTEQTAPSVESALYAAGAARIIPTTIEP